MASKIPTPSYPTRSLQFLSQLKGDPQTTQERSDDTKPNFTDDRAAVVPLRIIVVGAGLGGLSAAIALARRGHSVTILEQASKLGEVGAGIQIPPNTTRILLDWGLGPLLDSKVVEPEAMSFLRWNNGKKIAHTKLVPDFRQNFGAPYFVAHRAHFHDALHQLAVELGVSIHTNSKVELFDEDAAVVHVQNGEFYSGDLIVAADGLKSLARKSILPGEDTSPELTGFAAYRATVDVAKIKADPELAPILEKPSINIWIGEDKHVMTYMIAGGQSFNMVLSHVDRSDPAGWNQKTAIEDMRRQFVGWDPRLVKIIYMIEHALKWPLMSGRPLEKWVAKSNRLLIIGDAAHAMVPYMSQGAAMAVEDGAALGEILSLVEKKEELPQALGLYEQVRSKRSYQMQEASLVNGKLWHFADGPEQMARDAATKAEVEGKHFAASANQWSDPVTQWWAYGYDAVEEISKIWNRFKHPTKRGT